jgi:hypothetical protein
LSKLGFGLPAIIFLTGGSPSELHWLSFAKARELGIEVTELPPTTEPPPTYATRSTAPTPIKPTTPAPSPTKALVNLRLRAAPDPLAADALPADQFIPAGTELLIIRDNCTVWTGSGRGSQDADNVWCPTTYGAVSGWVNAYYVQTNWQRTDRTARLACYLYSSARGCAR